MMSIKSNINPVSSGPAISLASPVLAGQSKDAKASQPDEGKREDFTSELQRAGALAQGMALVNPMVNPVTSSAAGPAMAPVTSPATGPIPMAVPSAQEKAGKAQDQVADEQGVIPASASRTGTSISVGMPGDEKSPATLYSARGMKTASATAELKPWSKDEAFEGPEENPGFKLLSVPEADKAPAQMNPVPSRDARGRAELEAPGPRLGRGSGLDAIKMDPRVGAILAEKGMAVQSGSPSYMRDSLREPMQRMDSPVEVEQQEPRLSHPLSALNGELLSVTTGPREGQRSSSPLKGDKLSSEEFLSTLRSVQQGPSPRQQQGFSSSEGQQGQQGQEGDSGLSWGKPQLRVIDGGTKEKRASFSIEPASAAPAWPSHGMVIPPQVSAAAVPVLVTGHVVPGAMMRERLSSEAVLGMSTGIRNLSAQGGGEMRIRLKPDNLGELNVRVRIEGANVGLQIQASDEKARKILEESIGHLKEGLASQSLTLGQWDLSVAAPSKSEGGEMRQDPQQNQSSFQDLSQNSGNQNHGGRSSNLAYGEAGSSDMDRISARQGRPGWEGSSREPGERAMSLASNGRLDVRA